VCDSSHLICEFLLSLAVFLESSLTVGSKMLNRKGFISSLLTSLVVLLSLVSGGFADSIVVFNEIMYHPAPGTDQTLEWVELYSQMAVDSWVCC